MRLVFVEDCLRQRHYLSVWNAKCVRRHRTLDLGAEPRVIRGGIFARREFGLEGRQLIHPLGLSY